MFKNYLKIALRNFLRNKTFSTINILGLTIGITACVLILLYVIYEYSYDDFHENANNIYCLQSGYYSDGNLIEQRYRSPCPMGPKMKEEFPEVLEFARLEPQGEWALSYQGIEFKPNNSYYADGSFLNMFSFPFVKGDPKTALSEPSTMVISESIAKRIFGNEDPVGKVLKNEWREDSWFTITGVFKDLPKNSHLQFDLLASLPVIDPYFQNNWDDFAFPLYVLLDPHADYQILESKLLEFYRKHQGGTEKIDFALKPLKDIHLYSDPLLQERTKHGDIHSIRILLLITLLVVLIAWINYINLSTIRSFDRAKEIGLKKVVGATRSQLIIQFLFESLLFNLLAIILAICLVEISLPAFNRLFGLYLSISLINETKNWLSISSIFFIGITLSGMGTALILSSLKPSSVLKGVIKGSVWGFKLRSCLVVFQFSACIALIASLITAYTQINFMKNHKLGMDIEKILLISKPDNDPDGKLVENGNIFVDELLKYSTITNVTLSDYPGRIYQAGYRWAREGSNEVHSIRRAFVDHNFIDTYQIELLAGRNFSKNRSTDRDALLINETALRTLGFNSPEEAIDKFLVYGREKVKIIGVIKDYNQLYLKQEINPVAFCTNFTSIDNTPIEYFSVRLNNNGFQASIELIKQNFSEIFPNSQFDYLILEDFFNRQYIADQKLRNMFGLFAFLAIIISCLGLWGLASYTTLQRTKEIGVRKVLGASVSGIVTLLSKEFIRWVLISNLIAWPIAWYAMNKWLQNFAYRISIGWWMFLLAGVLALVIALLTVSFQAIKAATANPVEALRYE